MSNITDLLNIYENTIKSANYQLSKIYNVLGDEGVDINTDDENVLEKLEEIINWMNKNHLLGVADAYNDLNNIKYDRILKRLNGELEDKELLAHQRFRQNEWTIGSKHYYFLEFSAMIKIFRALEDLNETSIIKLDEEMDLSLNYLVNNLANDYNNYNITSKDVYDFIHMELNKDSEQPERYFIINRTEMIGDREVEHFVTIERGVTAQHAFKRFAEKTDLFGCEIFIRNSNNEIEAKNYL